VNTLTVGEFIEVLKQFPQGLPLIAFLEGCSVPILKECISIDDYYDYSKLEKCTCVEIDVNIIK